MASYPKFIINQDGVLKFGHVDQHKDLLGWMEFCEYGGGWWRIDEGRQAILLYGRSYDFGPPQFEHLRRIDWSGVGGTPRQLLFLPTDNENDRVEPIFANPNNPL